MKKSNSYKVFLFFNFIFMMFIVIVMLFPYLNIIAKSFNDGADTMKGGLTVYPRIFTLENFKTLMKDNSLISAAEVSVLRVITGVVLTLLVQFAAAYALTKNFRGKSIALTLYMIPMFVSAGQMPTYVLFSKMGLLNKFWVYILPSLFSFYNVIIIRTFLQNTIPASLEESAIIDGAGELTVFSKIILPLSKPILATIALWTMVMHWNDYTTTLLYIRKPGLYTLQYKMMELVKESERLQSIIAAARENGEAVDETLLNQMPTSEGITAAQIVLTTLPIICVYPFLQKYFVKGIMAGSIKG
ncbi:MAG: carbohydrate ABC transporter permease [Clostridia bacterium]|nr:carbohydrate ABC transporter permease [Clostridia bacterium]